MNTLTKTDLYFVLSRLPRDIRVLMGKYPLILAGGFIRSTIAGEKPSDIDLFGSNELLLKTAAADIALERRTKCYTTKNAISIYAPPRLPVQFITRWMYEQSFDLIQSFDFTIAKAAVWREMGTWMSVIDDNFYSDLAARRLVYTFPQRNEDAGGSIMRLRKFLAKGYTVQAPSLAGVIARLIKNLDVERFESNNLSDEHGVARILTGLLREVDPNVIIDGCEPIDEHEVIQ